eukprot:766992-Hanusia_phi.AAC.1
MEKNRSNALTQLLTTLSVSLLFPAPSPRAPAGGQPIRQSRRGLGPALCQPVASPPLTLLSHISLLNH